jgi:hypothetical protein
MKKDGKLQKMRFGEGEALKKDPVGEGLQDQWLSLKDNPPLVSLENDNPPIVLPASQPPPASPNSTSGNGESISDASFGGITNMCESFEED